MELPSKVFVLLFFYDEHKHKQFHCRDGRDDVIFNAITKNFNYAKNAAFNRWQMKRKPLKIHCLMVQYKWYSEKMENKIVLS